jgi:hypothetical protein
MQFFPALAVLVREMQKNGFDDRQARRYDRAFRATQLTAVALMCARKGVRENEMLEAARISPRVAADILDLVARMEVSSAFVRHIHSGQRF